MQVVRGCADRPGKIIPSISGSSSRADCVDHHRHIVQICRLGRSNSFAPVSAPQGLQEAHSLHLLVPGAAVVGGTSQPIKNSSSGSPNKSADTLFARVSAPQGLQEAHVLHLLVPGAGVVGGTSRPMSVFPTMSVMPTNQKEGALEALGSTCRGK